jgi:Na+(H+)/acetate symporter ActP
VPIWATVKQALHGVGKLRWIGTFIGFVGFIGFIGSIGFIVTTSLLELLIAAKNRKIGMWPQ